MDANHKKQLLNKIAQDYENQIGKASLAVARHIKEDVFKCLSKDIEAADTPSIIFTAGAPACGKSETVKYILEKRPRTLHIDPDDFRSLFPYYLGTNSENYQKSCTHIMSYCFKQAIRGNYSGVSRSCHRYSGVNQRSSWYRFASVRQLRAWRRL